MTELTPVSPQAPKPGDTPSGSELHLEWIEPDRNRFRFYRLAIEDNLFGDSSLLIHWGRIGRCGFQRIHASGSAAELRLKAQHIARTKARKGYRAPPEVLKAWRVSLPDVSAETQTSMVVEGDLFAK